MRKSSNLLICAVILFVSLGGFSSPIAQPRAQAVMIRITERGYEPLSFKLRRGVPARITFWRTSDATCAKAIVLPDFNIRRALPLNQPVVVRFTPNKTGSFTFVCGLNMMRGQLIVQ